MIALITSTLVPETYSFFPPEERYQQTIATLKSLEKVKFDKIYLLDNSTKPIKDQKFKFKPDDKLIIFQALQYAFKNKGLNEALLLLNHLSHISENGPILKISGRYKLSEQFNVDILLNKLGKNEILGVGAIKSGKNDYFNTRCYLVKDKKTLEEILVLAIEEMIAYGRGINGIRSLTSMFRPKLGTPFQLSLENAFARVLQSRQNYMLIEKINIEGFIAGSEDLNFISE